MSGRASDTPFLSFRKTTHRRWWSTILAMRIPGWLVCALAIGFSCLPAPSAQAQSAENVAVVVNDNSDDSKRIAEYYVRTRAVPAANVFHIQTTTDESIERAEYVRTIESPLGSEIRRAGLQDR